MDFEEFDFNEDDLWGVSPKDEKFINATILYHINLPILYPYPPSIWN